MAKTTSDSTCRPPISIACHFRPRAAWTRKLIAFNESLSRESSLDFKIFGTPRISPAGADLAAPFPATRPRLAFVRFIAVASSDVPPLADEAKGISLFTSISLKLSRIYGGDTYDGLKDLAHLVLRLLQRCRQTLSQAATSVASVFPRLPQLLYHLLRIQHAGISDVLTLSACLEDAGRLYAVRNSCSRNA